MHVNRHDVIFPLTKTILLPAQKFEVMMISLLQFTWNYRSVLVDIWNRINIFEIIQFRSLWHDTIYILESLYDNTSSYNQSLLISTLFIMILISHRCTRVDFERGGSFNLTYRLNKRMMISMSTWRSVVTVILSGKERFLLNDHDWR